MTRATSKRPAPELPSDDPLEFVAAYCKRRKIAFEIGHSAVERECLEAAADAREQYKAMRNALHAAAAADADAPAPDRRGLSPAQKYTIRLHNNRKSANASKVYAEVLKREHAARLASQDVAAHTSHARTVHLTARVHALEQSLANEKSHVSVLQKENERLKLRLESRTCVPRNATPPIADVPVAASTALHQRIVNSRVSNVVTSWSQLSQPLALHESDGKEFHTGLTCSQSQDVEDKPQVLPRVSLPISSAVQIGVLNSSQTSHDMTPFKSLNSDELVAPCPGSDFFNGSQPNPKLLCP
eukprot:TRINITY_DN575_c0_g2_i1.p1 TRINITY_DN575_c0_g2~~TRINITY_DN575_c0_g2_i1.p1  ORF type:complete len:300 (+),score=59.19 TRINITY_DN575_c0_g2_i1:132-1031(+)